MSDCSRNAVIRPWQSMKMIDCRSSSDITRLNFTVRTPKRLQASRIWDIFAVDIRLMK